MNHVRQNHVCFIKLRQALITYLWLKKMFGQILLFFPMLTSEQICELKMQLSKK